MRTVKRDAVAVIFVSRRSPGDDAGYAAAAEAMVETASRQPGFLGIDSVRDASGHGITVSFWEDAAAVRAWREHAEHAAIRAKGRADWYADFRVIVARVDREYGSGREAPAEKRPVANDRPESLGEDA